MAVAGQGFRTAVTREAAAESEARATSSQAKKDSKRACDTLTNRQAGTQQSVG